MAKDQAELRYCEKCEYAIPRIFCGANAAMNPYTGMWDYINVRQRDKTNNEGQCLDYKEKVK